MDDDNFKVSNLLSIYYDSYLQCIEMLQVGEYFLSSVLDITTFDIS